MKRIFRGKVAGSIAEGTKFFFPTVRTCGDAEEAGFGVTGSDIADKLAPSLDLIVAEATH